MSNECGIATSALSKAFVSEARLWLTFLSGLDSLAHPPHDPQKQHQEEQAEEEAPRNQAIRSDTMRRESASGNDSLASHASSAHQILLPMRDCFHCSSETKSTRRGASSSIPLSRCRHQPHNLPLFHHIYANTLHTNTINTPESGVPTSFSCSSTTPFECASNKLACVEQPAQNILETLPQYLSAVRDYVSRRFQVIGWKSAR